MRLRCIVVKCSFKAKRPVNPAYPKELNTLGDYLRKERLDRKLSQPDVAKLLNVTPDTITAWELNRNQPTAKLAKKVIDFLGYFPFSFEGASIGEQLYYARLILGKTQKEAAEIIGCDASNLRLIELDKRKPHERINRKIRESLSVILAP